MICFQMTTKYSLIIKKLIRFKDLRRKRERQVRVGEQKEQLWITLKPESRLRHIWCYRPGVLGGVWAQYLHSYQKGATFSHIEGELQCRKVLRALDFTQVYLSPKKWKRQALLKHTHPSTHWSYFSSHFSPLQTAPPRASPWRWDTGAAALEAGQHQLQGLKRPRPEQRRCCCHWHLASSRCLPRHSGGRWGASGETRAEREKGKEGTRGREEAHPVLGGNLSPCQSPDHKLKRGGRCREAGWDWETTVREEMCNQIHFKNRAVSKQFGNYCCEGMDWIIWDLFNNVQHIY